MKGKSQLIGSGWCLDKLRILEVSKIEGAKKLYKLNVDLGKEKRQIVSGLVPYYTEEELLNKKVIVVTNLKPAVLCKTESYGMILAAGDKENVKLITVDGEMENGEGVH